MLGQLDGQVWSTAGFRHNERRQCWQQVGDGCVVIGQWRHGVGITGVGDQCCQAIAAGIENVVDFLNRPFGTGRFNVFCGHGIRHIQQHHQRVVIFVDRLWQLLPAGACGGKNRQQAANGQPAQLRHVLVGRRLFDHVIDQLWVDHLMPLSLLFAALLAQQQQGNQGYQHQ